MNKLIREAINKTNSMKVHFHSVNFAADVKLLDFAQKKGTPVKAMNNGIVTLSENDLYYTGGTIIFDHGHGVSTLYMHMDKIFVKVGDHVKKGDVVGTVGETGRATGPHLDIRLNWFGERLDPMSVLENK